ncbi:protein RST1 isoform X3 [Dioscorea cayenensis subsp. rotundata]|nr:protein RST1 isoform X3 [Dioscorea cayenensis subsp. rotundata]
MLSVQEELSSDAQACRMEILETVLSVCTSLNIPPGGIEILTGLAKRFLMAQKELGLHYLPEFYLVSLSMSVTLTRVGFEHEQLSILKLLTFLVKWKTETEYPMKGVTSHLSEELLFIFPVINLLVSPSKSVKAAASYLLILVERLVAELSVEPNKFSKSSSQFQHTSKLESITFRLLNHLWFQEPPPIHHSFPREFYCNDVLQMKETNNEYLRDDSFFTIDRLKFSLSQPQGEKLPGMHMLICSVISILVMHPTCGVSAVESLSAIGVMDPNLGIPMLLGILFYVKTLYNYVGNSHEILIRLLRIIPSLAVHSSMVPLIIQTLTPLLHKDAKPLLYAVAVRLLCKTWVVTDRVFGTVQGLLNQKAFSDFKSERDICTSIAASVRDVCKHHPDRGVDLILSVSSSIESQDFVLQALGFESLAYLCEADVVDFYTAWKVIAKFVTDYSVNSVLANRLCTLLQFGAMDAEAYPDISKIILQILWDVATSKSYCSSQLWVKARISAFKSLSFYEIMHVQEAIPNFKRRNLECLVSEDNAEVLKAMEGLEVKIINFEHINRRRGLKEKRVIVHKVEKFLEAFPQVIFSTDARKQKAGASEFPGAALLSIVFTPTDFPSQGILLKDLKKLHTTYENALLEIAEALNLPRNILFALLSIQSWKPFLHHWMRAAITLTEKVSSKSSEKSSRAANDIFKVMCTVAVKSIPRAAVNIALAIGALCMVAPPSAHAVISSAAKFLLNWLFEYQHEYQQWSAAISLGLVSNCLHATDKQLKFEVITGLLKVLDESKSHLVKGACGVGLGLSCQGLFSRVHPDVNSNLEERSTGHLEATLLQNVIRTLSLVLSQLCPSESNSIKSFYDCFSPDGGVTVGDECSSSQQLYFHDSEEDMWGIAGLVFGLGYSAIAIYRLGNYDAVLKMREMLISWMSHTSSSCKNSSTRDEMSEIQLSIGSCITLPAVASFCLRVELVDDDLGFLFNSYGSLISDLLNSQKSGTLYQNLFMASCTGAGSLLSYIINDGVQPMKFDDVKNLLEILRSTYCHPYPPVVQFGGMLGVVNALGARAGDLTQMHPQPFSMHISNDQQQESLLVRGPILMSHVCESLSISVTQEILLLAKDSKDPQIRSYAAWAISFLRHHWFAKEFQSTSDSQSSSNDSKSSSRSVAEDSLVWNLCLWLKDNIYNQVTEILQTSTISTVLRCLSKAPRLLAMDWAVIMRSCMRYETQISAKSQMSQFPKVLREECIYFSIAHANDVSSLLLFLDELTDLPRFKTLESNLQQALLHHLSGLLRIFSGSRMKKLLEDMIEYFCSSSSSRLIHELDDKSLLRVSCWSGLQLCLIEASIEPILLSKIENCMEGLFYLLPVLTTDNTPGRALSNAEEWSEAIQCLAKARKDWVMGLLQVSDINGGNHSVEVAKRILARSSLVRLGCLSVSDLRNLKAYLLDGGSEGIWWSCLLEVAAAITNEADNVKRQWLLDALEMSCMSEYPSTALRFIGLLSSNCCKLMPLLTVDPATVLSDLPATLPSLLTDSNWSSSAEFIVNKLWVSTERICNWASQLNVEGDNSGQHQIHQSEAKISAFLSQVMHQTCVILKDYLPLDKQLKLVNLSFCLMN